MVDGIRARANCSHAIHATISNSNRNGFQYFGIFQAIWRYAPLHRICHARPVRRCQWPNLLQRIFSNICWETMPIGGKDTV